MSARILILAALGLATTASVAPAQFSRFRSQNYGVNYGYSPYGGFYFNTYQSYQYSFQAIFNGRPVTYQYQFNYSGPPRPNYYYPPAYYGNPYTSLSGGVGSSFGSDQFNPIANQQRAAIARAQRLMDADNNPAGGRKDDIENWVAAQQQDRGNDPAAVPAIDPALIDPPDDAILSGKALNELLALCRKQEKGGRRADSGLCPPDLLEKVVFDGGAAAAGVNLFRKTALPYPSVVVVPETDKLRAVLDADFTAVGQTLRAGKRANEFAVDRMETNITAARAALNKRMKDAPFAEAKEVNDFLTQLALAARFARSATAPAALPASWNTTGATVGELVALMDKFKLQFGPAASGGEPAYLSLHRGLLGYYVRLTPVKKN